MNTKPRIFFETGISMISSGNTFCPYGSIGVIGVVLSRLLNKARHVAMGRYEPSERVFNLLPYLMEASIRLQQYEGGALKEKVFSCSTDDTIEVQGGVRLALLALEVVKERALLLSVDGYVIYPITDWLLKSKEKNGTVSRSLGDLMRHNFVLPA